MNAVDSRSADVEALVHAAREEITRADGKAELLLAALGVGVGALLSGLLSSGWTPAHLHGAAAGLWWLGAVTLAASGGLLMAAVFPRLRMASAEGPAFVMLARVRSVGEATTLLDHAAKDPLASRLSAAVALSSIAVVKYQMIRSALWSAAVGCAALIASGLTALAT